MNIGYVCKDDFMDSAVKELIKSNENVGNVVLINISDLMLQKIESHQVKLVFIDLNVLKETGLEIGDLIKKTYYDVDIVFIDKNQNRTLAAFKISADGYIIKPVNEEKIHFEINKSCERRHHSKKNIFIKTFGYFDIFVNGDAVHFSNSKSKEFLALLVDRCGGTVDMDQAITYLWPEREYDDNVKSRYRNMLKEMREVLIEADIYEIISEKRNSRSANRSQFQCDYYRLLTGDSKTIENFTGNYMFNYGWSETTLVDIEKFIENFHSSID